MRLGYDSCHRCGSCMHPAGYEHVQDKLAIRLACQRCPWSVVLILADEQPYAKPKKIKVKTQ